MNFIHNHHRSLIWTLVVLSAIMSIFVTAHYQLLGERPDIMDEAQKLEAYQQTIRDGQLAYRKQFEGDTGGADTPDEAVRIQIEALVRGDIEGAAMMQSPETRQEFVKNVKNWISKGSRFSELENAYKTGDIKSWETARGHTIDITAKGDEAGFIFDLVQSPVTKKWYSTKL